MSTVELTSKIEALKEWEAVIEEAQAEAEALKDELKAHMGASEELCAGEYRITWKPVESARVDTAALRREMPGIAEAFTRKSTARRFCVSLV